MRAHTKRVLAGTCITQAERDLVIEMFRFSMCFLENCSMLLKTAGQQMLSSGNVELPRHCVHKQPPLVTVIPIRCSDKGYDT